MAMEMGKDEDGKKKKNVVMFPFMAQGHIIPFMALALRIELVCPEYTVSLISTPLNIAKLRSSLPPSSAVRLVPIPFRSADHGLPPDSENTDSLPYSLVDQLLWASISLRPAFADLLRRLRPICVVADIFFGWTAPVARDLGVFHVIFSGSGGFGLACYCSLWLHLPHRRRAGEEGGSGSSSFYLPDFPEAGSLSVSQLPDNIATADGRDSWSTFQAENFSAWSQSNGILFNTVADLDRLGLSYFERKFRHPVWPVGPVLLPKECRPEAGKASLDWLDSKPARSVVYVSFGSMNTISAEQMVQLATALEASGRSFLWVVRPPAGFDINGEFRAGEWLPEGFEDRVGDKGLVVRGWAPQVEILAHTAVAAFVSHCGWNSVLESLSNGVPILGWPMAAEQFFNSEMLQKEVGVCVEMARGKASMLDVPGFVRSIELVVGDTETGAEMRKKASLVKASISESSYSSSSRALRDFFTAATMHLSSN